MRTPEDNLNLLVSRFENLGPGSLRLGRLYPDLTSHGLVAVAMDETYRTSLPLAQVVVITDESISAAIHCANLKSDKNNQPGQYTSLALGAKQYEPGGFSFDLHAKNPDLSPEEWEAERKRMVSVTQILGNLAERGSAYDPLHTIYHNRYPAAPAGQEDRYPFAGQLYSARINFEALLESSEGPHMHAAVHEAAKAMPPVETL